MRFFSALSERNPRLKKWWARWGRHAPSMALVVGFIWDYFLFQKPDRPLENVLISAHLALALFGVILLNVRGREAVIARIPLILLIQFNFGALAKSLLVLYAKSGTWEGSALFFIFFACFVIGNEFAHNRYEELHYHISALYFITLLYSALIVPVLLGKIGVQAFVISILAALAFIAAFITLLRLIMPRRVTGTLSDIGIWIGTITILFISLYVVHLIPPVPLAMTESGIYHSISRSGDRFAATYEAPPFYKPWQSTNTRFHTGGGDGAYCFSAIYAPDRISTSITHRWEMQDSDTKEWVERSRISFRINGGRDHGYRGYTVKSLLEPGKWRCVVETSRGELLGRVEFTVVSGTTTLTATEL